MSEREREREKRFLELEEGPFDWRLEQFPSALLVVGSISIPRCGQKICSVFCFQENPNKAMSFAAVSFTLRRSFKMTIMLAWSVLFLRIVDGPELLARAGVWHVGKSSFA